jgi:hypothetical protein
MLSGWLDTSRQVPDTERLRGRLVHPVFAGKIVGNATAAPSDATCVTFHDLRLVCKEYGDGGTDWN